MSLVKRQRTDGGALVTTDSKSGKRSVLQEGIVLESNTGGSLLAGSFSRDGTLIATGGTDKLINIWSYPGSSNDFTSSNTLTIAGHKSAVTSLKWSADNFLIFSTSADKTLGIWDTETGQRVRKLRGHGLVVNELTVFEDSGSQLLVSCSDDGALYLWDAREKVHVKEYKTEYPLLTCVINNGKTTIYTSGIDPMVQAIDLKNFEKPLWTAESHKDFVTSLSITQDDHILVSRSNDGTLRTYNSKSFVPNSTSRERAGIYDGSVSSYDSVIRCKVAGNFVVSGGDDKNLTVWDFHSRKMLKKLGGHLGGVLDVDFHPGGKVVLSTSTDGTCIIRSIA